MNVEVCSGGDAAKHREFAVTGGFGDEQIAVGSPADDAGIGQTRGEELDFESRGRLGPDIGGTGDDLGARHRRGSGAGFRKTLDGDVTPNAGLHVGEAGEGRIAGEYVFRVGIAGCEFDGCRAGQQCGACNRRAQRKFHNCFKPSFLVLSEGIYLLGFAASKRIDFRALASPFIAVEPAGNPFCFSM